METISELPKGEPTIGIKSTLKGIKDGKVKKVVVANNCPQFLRDKLKKSKIVEFDGDQQHLGTRLGKPFFVAVAGFSE